MSELQRIERLEGRIQELEAMIKSIPRNSAATSSESTSIMLGSLPASLKRILNLGFEWVGSKVNIKAKTNAGITVDTSGVGAKVRANYGINLDSHGLALKKQEVVTPADATTLIEIDTGTDHVDIALINIRFVTLKTEIDAIKDVLNEIITKLQSAEVTS